MHISNPFGNKLPVYNDSLLFITLGRATVGVVNGFSQDNHEDNPCTLFLCGNCLKLYCLLSNPALHANITDPQHHLKKLPSTPSIFLKFCLQNSVTCMSSSWCHAEKSRRTRWRIRKMQKDREEWKVGRIACTTIWWHCNLIFHPVDNMRTRVGYVSILIWSLTSSSQTQALALESNPTTSPWSLRDLVWSIF